MKKIKFNKEDKILAEDSAINIADVIVDEIAKNIPGINIAWGLSKALYGAGMKLRQERALEWVEMVRDNPSVFTKYVLNDEMFQDGFVYSLEKYLTARAGEKRIYLKNVFLGYAQSESKNQFELERLNDAYLKISPQSLKSLLFIAKEILPLKEKIIREELKKKNTQESNKTEEWWFKLDWEREPLSRFLLQWLHENYNPNSPKVKNQYNVKGDWDKKIIDEVFEIEREKSREVFEAIDELVNLGILKLQVAKGGGFGLTGGAVYDFSKFGYEFLKYLNAQDYSDI